MEKRKWTQDEIDALKRMYPDHFAGEIGAVLNRKKASVYCMAQKLGLRSSEDKIRRTGLCSCHSPGTRASQFKKGHVPMNKGKKVSPEVYAKCAPTMFQKGHTPHNHRKVGSERINKDGYWEVKVEEPKKWVAKHRLIWERVNGPIPKGYNVQFRDHNPRNLDISNLYLISKAEQMRTENSLIARYPKELQEVIRLRGVVNRQIHKKEKLQNGK